MKTRLLPITLIVVSGAFTGCTCLTSDTSTTVAATAASVAAKPAPAPKPARPVPNPLEQFRGLWTGAGASASGVGGLTDWLMCGSFPNPPHAGQKSYNHKPPCVGFETDYLADLGGEANVRPEVGLACMREDGTEAVWFEHKAGRPNIDLRKIFDQRKEPCDNALIYAWTTFEADAGKGVMSVGSDDGVMLWLNGELVHEVLAGRACVPHSDIVPVTFRDGENAVMVKVENGNGKWGMFVQPLRGDSLALLADSPPKIKLHYNGRPRHQTLTIHTDEGLGKAIPGAQPMRVEVVAPGGHVQGAAEVERGEPAVFQAKTWPNGPYWVHVSRARADRPREYFHLFWYRGGWQAAADELLAEARSLLEAGERTGASAHIVHLADLVRDRLYNMPGNFDYSGPRPKMKGNFAGDIQRLLFQYAEAKAGAAGPRHGHAFRRLAWWDGVDDTVQTARAYTPPGYDHSRAWPLLVNLHGYRRPNPPPLRSPDLLKWWAPDFTDLHGVILVEPHGRGNTDFEGIGERAVMRAVNQARRVFNVDPARIYLKGHSMGGTGAWHLGTRHTDRFAALASSSGGWDPRAQLSPEVYAKLTRRERFLHDSRGQFVQAECLSHTPVYVSHGRNDDLVPAAGARYVVEQLQRWGYPVRLWWHHNKGHGGLDDQAVVVDWLLQQRRPAAPTSVRLRAPALDRAAAHWLRVLGCKDPFAFIHGEARVRPDGVLEVKTENATRIRLGPLAGLPVTGNGPVRVFWNGEDCGLRPVNDGGIELSAPGLRPWDRGKSPGLSGPIRAVTSTPFAIVLGTTSADKKMNRVCRLLAENARNEWHRWQHTTPRYFLDTQITEEQLAEYSLILYGGPQDNQVTHKLMPHLPLQVWRDEIQIGERSFRCADAGVGMIHPHPLNPERYVVVYAGTSAKGMFHTRFIDTEMDYAVVDGRGRAGKRGTWVSVPAIPWERLQIVSGRFNGRWEFDSAYAISGDGRRRRATPASPMPTRPSAHSVWPMMWVSDILPTRVSGHFLHMGVDRSFTGGPLQLGDVTYGKGISAQTGHAPSVATYDLTGAGWSQLEGALGLEITDRDGLDNKHKQGTKIRFIVRGDGKELYKSAVIGWDSKPGVMRVDIRGVRKLELEVANEKDWHSAASSVNWAGLKLLRW